jgi:Nitrile hydratase beta subunit
MLLTAEIVPTVVATGASARVAKHVAPRFRVGDRVRVRNLNPSTHTRLPRYIRDKVGIVEFDYGVFAFPDTHAHGQGENPQHCYRVRFTARELWGPTAAERDTLRVDVFDDYIDPD